MAASLLLAIIFSYHFFSKRNNEVIVSQATSAPISISATSTQAQVLAVANRQDPLGGYDILIADRGNNRLIEVNPNKKIVWEYDFQLPGAGLGADDAFFVDSGRTVIVNLEMYHMIEQIDYQSKQVIWSYGTPGRSGSAVNLLNRPDDAFKLENGDVIVADIRNCRVIEITPDKKIVNQYGIMPCSNAPNHLDKPNSATLLDNGHILISNIVGNTLTELDQNWKEVSSVKIPLTYPSDPRPTKSGNILIADYKNPGKIIEMTPGGSVVWEYFHAQGSLALNHPSLAMELPNGNIIVNDDYNHRVIVIDKTTKNIVWEYGIIGKPGNGSLRLSIPDGVDFIMRSASDTSFPQTQAFTVGYITSHSSELVGTVMKVDGYMLKQENGYLMFSDESSGNISSGDLPVLTSGTDSFAPNQKYQLIGELINGGIDAINKNTYHFEFSLSSAL